MLRTQTRGAVPRSFAAAGAVAVPSLPAPALLSDPDENNALRRLALTMAAALLFVRVSNIAQLQQYVLKFNLELMYFVGIPAFAGAILCSGVPRAFRSKATYYWVAFIAWFLVSCLFSEWRAESVSKGLYYVRIEGMMVFVLGGLVVNWKDCQKLLNALFWASCVFVASGKLFEKETVNERLALQFGSFGNSNDLAATVLFCLPFLYLRVVSPKTRVGQLAALGLSVYCIVLALQTGSRGALIAMGVMAVAFFVWSSMRVRMILVVGILLAALLASVALSSNLTRRLTSFSADSADVSEEALASSGQREYLLRKSLEYTFTHPIFGVGPFQFPLYEGTHNQINNMHGAWMGTHNSFTQISSECGLPSFLFYMGSLLLAFRMLHRVFRAATVRQDCRDIRDAAFCCMLSMVGFFTAATFLNLGYAPQTPIFIGVAIAISRGAEVEFARRSYLGALGMRTPAVTAAAGRAPTAVHASV